MIYSQNLNDFSYEPRYTVYRIPRHRPVSDDKTFWTLLPQVEIDITITPNKLSLVELDLDAGTRLDPVESITEVHLSKSLLLSASAYSMLYTI